MKQEEIDAGFGETRGFRSNQELMVAGFIEQLSSSEGAPAFRVWLRPAAAVVGTSCDSWDRRSALRVGPASDSGGTMLTSPCQPRFCSKTMLPGMEFLHTPPTNTAD